MGISDKSHTNKCELLSAVDTEKVLRLCCLIGKIGLIVEESGITGNFDAPTWLSKWLYSPSFALSGELPAKLIGTSEGIDYLRQQIEAMQSAAYL